MKTIATLIIIAIFTFTISCKSDSSNTTDIDSTETITNIDTTNNQSTTLGKEYTSAYICPNHCDGSGSEEFGECPVCGMEYIENPDNQ